MERRKSLSSEDSVADPNKEKRLRVALLSRRGCCGAGLASSPTAARGKQPAGDLDDVSDSSSTRSTPNNRWAIALCRSTCSLCPMCRSEKTRLMWCDVMGFAHDVALPATNDTSCVLVSTRASIPGCSSPRHTQTATQREGERQREEEEDEVTVELVP